jgi:hypothetical protein
MLSEKCCDCNSFLDAFERLRDAKSSMLRWRRRKEFVYRNDSVSVDGQQPVGNEHGTLELKKMLQVASRLQ